MTKRELRLRLHAERRALSVARASELGAEVCSRLMALAAFTGARHVVAYAAVDNEVDPAPAVAQARAAGTPVYFPCRRGDDLVFVRAEPGDLVRGHGGIPEPPAGPLLAPATAGVVFLVPGIAFDPHGARLGRGAGCYDRALARHADGARIGLAYEFQLVPTLPAAAWDIPMDAVVTEARALATSGAPATRVRPG